MKGREKFVLQCDTISYGKTWQWHISQADVKVKIEILHNEKLAILEKDVREEYKMRRQQILVRTL